MDRFFDRALAKEPEGRFQDGLAFKRELEEIQKSVGRPRLPEVPVRSGTPMLARSVKNGKGISALEGTFAVVMLILALLPGLWALWSGRGASSARNGSSPRAEAAAPEAGATGSGVDEAFGTSGPSRGARDGNAAGGRSGRKNSGTSGTKKSGSSLSRNQAPAASGMSPDPRAGRSPEAAARATRRDPASGGAVRSRKAALPPPTEEIQHRSSEAPASVEEPLATPIEPQSAPSSPPAEESSYLLIDAKSMVKLGKLTVLVDGREVYSRDLSTQESPGSDIVKKKLFRRKQEHFSARIKVSPGRHEIVVLVIPDGMSSGFKDRTVVDLKVSESRKLQLVAGRLLGSPLSIKAD
jgi:hypothetical protein